MADDSHCASRRNALVLRDPSIHGARCHPAGTWPCRKQPPDQRPFGSAARRLSLLGTHFYGAVGAAAGFAAAHRLTAPLWWHGVRRAAVEAADGVQRPDQPPLSRELPLRLLLVTWTLHENGGLRVVAELARRWNLSGTPAEVFALQPARARAVRVDNMVPLRYGCMRHQRLRYAWPMALARLVRAGRDVDVVVSTNEIGMSLFFSFVAARLTRRRFAVIVHSSLQAAMNAWMPSYLHPVVRWIHRRADATVCVSPTVVPQLLMIGVRQQRIRVIPNGIDVDGVRALAMQPAKVTPPDRVTVIAAGRLSTEKGFDLLIRAHAQVRHAGVDHCVVILGEGPERASLLALARSLRISDSVKLPGFQINPFAEIAVADLFCLPIPLRRISARPAQGARPRDSDRGL